MGKTVKKCHLKGKASKKLANGQNIDYSEKRKRPKGFICPCTGVKYHNIQTCLLVYAADSGERLQDHWSSVFCFLFCSKRQGGSNVYPQSMFWSKNNNKKKVNHCIPQFCFIKRGCEGGIYCMDMFPCCFLDDFYRFGWELVN